MKGRKELIYTIRNAIFSEKVTQINWANYRYMGELLEQGTLSGYPLEQIAIEAIFFKNVEHNSTQVEDFIAELKKNVVNSDVVGVYSESNLYELLIFLLQVKIADSSNFKTLALNYLKDTEFIGFNYLFTLNLIKKNLYEFAEYIEANYEDFDEEFESDLFKQVAKDVRGKKLVFNYNLVTSDNVFFNISKIADMAEIFNAFKFSKKDIGAERFLQLKNFYKCGTFTSGLVPNDWLWNPNFNHILNILYNRKRKTKSLREAIAIYSIQEINRLELGLEDEIMQFAIKLLKGHTNESLLMIYLFKKDLSGDNIFFEEFLAENRSRTFSYKLKEELSVEFLIVNAQNVLKLVNRNIFSFGFVKEQFTEVLVQIFKEHAKALDKEKANKYSSLEGELNGFVLINGLYPKSQIYTDCFNDYLKERIRLNSYLPDSLVLSLKNSKDIECSIGKAIEKVIVENKKSLSKLNELIEALLELKYPFNKEALKVIEHFYIFDGNNTYLRFLNMITINPYYLEALSITEEALYEFLTGEDIRLPWGFCNLNGFIKNMKNELFGEFHEEKLAILSGAGSDYELRRSIEKLNDLKEKMEENEFIELKLEFILRNACIIASSDESIQVLYKEKFITKQGAINLLMLNAERRVNTWD